MAWHERHETLAVAQTESSVAYSLLDVIGVEPSIVSSIKLNLEAGKLFHEMQLTLYITPEMLELAIKLSAQQDVYVYDEGDYVPQRSRTRH